MTIDHRLNAAVAIAQIFRHPGDVSQRHVSSVLAELIKLERAMEPSVPVRLIRQVLRETSPIDREWLERLCDEAEGSAEP